MKNGTNDNEKLSFTKIGLAAALVLNKLRNHTQIKDVSEQPDSGSESRDKERETSQREYVDRRLRDLATFEDRARGKRRNV